MASTTTAASGGISSEELRTLRYFYVVRKWGQKVLCRFLCLVILENNTKSIWQQLWHYILRDDIYKWFKPRELDKIRNIGPEKLDITLLVSICQIFWHNGIRIFDPGDELKNLMDGIRIERNNVSHEDMVFSEAKLEDKLNRFEYNLVNALNTAKRKYRAFAPDFNQLRSEITENIKKTKEKIREPFDPLNPEDVWKLKAELIDFRNQLIEDIRDRCSSELISLYKELRRIPPFDWLHDFDITEPSTTIVNLSVDADKDTQFGAKTITFNQNEILEAKKHDGDDPEVVIISGEAGTGKTFLMRFIIEKWSKDEKGDFPGMCNYSLLLPTEFRDRRLKNFGNYIKDILPRVVADYDLQCAKSAILQSECIFLCDGFDEHNVASKNIFIEILKLKCNKKKIIVTTRPAHIIELNGIVNKSGRKRLNLKLLGVPESSQVSHIKDMVNYLKANKTQEKKDETVGKIAEEFRSMHPEMKALMKNPLYMNLYILLRTENPRLKDTVNTKTKLFSVIKRHVKKRLKEKATINDIVNKEKLVDQFFNACNKLCLEMHLLRKYELTKEHVEVLELKSGELDFETVMSAYFGIKHSRRLGDVEKVWCFRHRTDQEYGSACAICDMILQTDKNEVAHFTRDNIISHILQNFKVEKSDEENESENYQENESESDQENESESDQENESESDYENESESDQENERKSGLSRKKGMQNVLVFVTGILKEKDRNILEKYTRDIIDKVYLENTFSYPAVNIDNLIDHVVESEKNSKVIDAVVKVLENKGKGGWMITNNNSLSCMRTLLNRLKPETIGMNLSHYDPATLPDLDHALKAIETNGVRMTLSLTKSFDRIMDTYPKCSLPRTLLEFSGSISEGGIQRLPFEVERLDLRLKLETLEDLSIRLPSLKQLRELALWIPFDTCDLDRLSPLRFTGRVLHLTIDAQEEGDCKALEVAQMLNAIYPRDESQQQQEEESNIRKFQRRSEQHQITTAKEAPLKIYKDGSITIYNSHFSDEDVRRFISSLKMKKLYSITLCDTLGITKEEKKGLQKISQSKGFSYLTIYDE